MDFHNHTATATATPTQQRDYNNLLSKVRACKQSNALQIKTKYNIDVNTPRFLSDTSAQPMPLLHAYLYYTRDATHRICRVMKLMKVLDVNPNQVVNIDGKNYTILLIALGKSEGLYLCQSIIDILDVDTSIPSTIIPCFETIAKKCLGLNLRDFIQNKCNNMQKVQTNAGFLLYCPFLNDEPHFASEIPFTLQILMDYAKQNPYFLPTDGRPPILHVAINYYCTVIMQTGNHARNTTIFLDIVQTLLDGGANPRAYPSHSSALEFYRTKLSELSLTEDAKISRLLKKGERAFVENPYYDKKLALGMGSQRRLGLISPLRLVDDSITQMIGRMAFEDKDTTTRHIEEARYRRFNAALLKFANLESEGDQLTERQIEIRKYYAKGEIRRSLTRKYIIELTTNDDD